MIEPVELKEIEAVYDGLSQLPDDTLDEDIGRIAAKLGDQIGNGAHRIAVMSRWLSLNKALAQSASERTGGPTQAEFAAAAVHPSDAPGEMFDLDSFRDLVSGFEKQSPEELPGLVTDFNTLWLAGEI